MTKIKTKFHLFFKIIFTYNFLFLIWGETMAHPGPSLPPSLLVNHDHSLITETKIISPFLKKGTIL
jgi:hypothetical protein